jgi:hypothetical protein
VRCRAGDASRRPFAQPDIQPDQLQERLPSGGLFACHWFKAANQSRKTLVRTRERRDTICRLTVTRQMRCPLSWISKSHDQMRHQRPTLEAPVRIFHRRLPLGCRVLPQRLACGLRYPDALRDRVLPSTRRMGGYGAPPRVMLNRLSSISMRMIRTVTPPCRSFILRSWRRSPIIGHCNPGKRAKNN